MEIGVSPRTFSNLNTLPGITCTVKLAQSEYGTPEPQLVIVHPKHGNSGRLAHRRTKATAYLFLAEIELAATFGDQWVASIAEAGDTRSTIVLELLRGDDAEVSEGLKALTAAVIKVGSR